MLIIGAKGFAKEVLEIFHEQGNIKNIAFYDDVNVETEEYLFDKYPILKSENQVKEFFRKYGKEFTIGIGNPLLRYRLFEKFKNLNGIYTSSISITSKIGSYNVEIGDGCNILTGSVISNGSEIGRGCMIYYHSIVAHDCTIGDFVEISPGATVLGRCKLGPFIHLGANSTILPDVTIGENVIVAAGAVVTKNLPDNCMVAGVPAVIKKKLLKPDFLSSFNFKL